MGTAGVGATSGRGLLTASGDAGVASGFDTSGAGGVPNGNAGAEVGGCARPSAGVGAGIGNGVGVEDAVSNAAGANIIVNSPGEALGFGADGGLAGIGATESEGTGIPASPAGIAVLSLTSECSAKLTGAAGCPERTYSTPWSNDFGSTGAPKIAEKESALATRGAEGAESAKVAGGAGGAAGAGGARVAGAAGGFAGAAASKGGKPGCGGETPALPAIGRGGTSAPALKGFLNETRIGGLAAGVGSASAELPPGGDDGSAPSPGGTPLSRPNHKPNDVKPGRNSVTTAKPDASVAVSNTMFLWPAGSDASCARIASTSSGPAASLMCTITTLPVATSWALCVRIPSSTRTHLSNRYRALKSSLMNRGHEEEDLTVRKAGRQPDR